MRLIYLCHYINCNGFNVLKYTEVMITFSFTNMKFDLLFSTIQINI